MKRVELYVSNDNRLVVGIFEPADSEYEKYVLKGADAYKYLKKLEREKVLDIVTEKRYDEMTLFYKNYIVNLNEYQQLLNRRGLKIIIDDIKEYKEKEKLKVIKGKKVKRKNKHVGKKIMAATLTLVVLYSVGNNLLKKDKAPVIEQTNIVSSVEHNIKEEPLNKVIKHTPQEKKVSSSSEEKEDLPSYKEKKQEKVMPSSGEDVLSITLDYPDWSNTKKANITRAYYSDMISKYARMYGIDPKLVLAVATQESETGIHKSTMDPGGATGLMQIQNDVWIGKNVSAYNFKTGQMDVVRVTNDNIGDLECNIRMGCMILQNSMEYMDYNILAGIQCYNMGCGNVDDILDTYSRKTGKSREVILSNPNDIGWMEFRKIKSVGEPEYVEKVLSWMGETNTIKNVKRDGTLVSLNVGNQTECQKVY